MRQKNKKQRATTLQERLHGMRDPQADMMISNLMIANCSCENSTITLGMALDIPNGTHHYRSYPVIAGFSLGLSQGYFPVSQLVVLYKILNGKLPVLDYAIQKLATRIKKRFHHL